MKQNILLITADQFRYDALGFKGVFPVKTPHLDSLAAGGTTFDQAYTPYPLCTPARASIMTGKHACRHQAYYNGMEMDDGETLPGVLSDNGYYTIQVGKTHFFPKRRHAGFDKLILPEDYAADMLRKYGKEKLYKIPENEPWDEMVVRHYSKTWNGSIDPEDYPACYHTTRALSELEKLTLRRECTGDADDPFFMWLSFQQPHSPCAPPPPYDTMYAPEDVSPPVKSEEELTLFAKPLLEFKKGWQALTPEIISKFRPRYLGDVTLIDAQIGRMIAGLEKLGLRENTIIIFTSDHGDYLGDHHQMQKAFFHDCSARIPLIFNGPGIAKGHTVATDVTLCDLKPTLLDHCQLLRQPRHDAEGNLLGNEWGELVDSRSFLPALKGQELPTDRAIFSESGIYGHAFMAKFGTQKYNFYPQTNEFDHFDLSADPSELHNLGAEVTWENLPSWARKIFEKILHSTEPMRQFGYGSTGGRILPMFT